MNSEYFYRKADRLSALVDIEPSRSRRFRLANLATRARHIGHRIAGRWTGAAYSFLPEELAELKGELDGVELDFYAFHRIARH